MKGTGQEVENVENVWGNIIHDGLSGIKWVRWCVKRYGARSASKMVRGKICDLQAKMVQSIINGVCLI